VKASRRDPDRQVALAVERYAVGIRSHWKERDFSPALEIPKRNSGLSRAGHEPPVLSDRQVFAIPDARERVAYQYLEFSTASELQDLELGPGDLSGEATAIPTDPRHQAPPAPGRQPKKLLSGFRMPDPQCLIPTIRQEILTRWAERNEEAFLVRGGDTPRDFP